MATVRDPIFCVHKRVRTACTDCRPSLRPVSALLQEDEERRVTPRR